MHIRSIVTPLLISTLALACQNATEKQREADRARQEAAEKSAQAQREADQTKAEQQAIADQKQREATLLLDEKKSDYRKRINETMSDIDQYVADLRTKDVTASPKEKAKNDRTIDTLNGHHRVLSRDLDELGKATAMSWDQVSKRIDRDLHDAKAAMSPFTPKI